VKSDLGQGEVKSDVVVAAGDHIAQRGGGREEQRVGFRRIVKYDVLRVLVQHLFVRVLVVNNTIPLYKGW
jgi:hypothetical protein